MCWKRKVPNGCLQEKRGKTEEIKEQGRKDVSEMPMYENAS